MTAAKLTILKTQPGQNLAKRRTSKGMFIPCDMVAHFSVIQAKINSACDIYKLLDQLQHRPRCCVIRGNYVGDEAAANLSRDGEPALTSKGARRWGEVFPDTSRQWLAIDVDAYSPQQHDPVSEPEGAIREFIDDCVPELEGVTFVYQLSSRAGFVPGVLKVHLWFWLATPTTSAELRRWAKSINSRNPDSIDEALYSSVQIHYTANPIFPAGVVDPIQKRVGLCQGAVDFASLSIPPAPKPARPKSEANNYDLVAGVSTPTLDRLQAALFWLNADVYGLWIDAGLWLKVLADVYGESVAFDLWIEWSRTSAKFYDADAATRWAGFDPYLGTDAAVGCLLAAARDAAVLVALADKGKAEWSERGACAVAYLKIHHPKRLAQLLEAA